MHAIVFAGGAGKRLWPLSRRSSPKQFTPLFDSSKKSSIRLAVERLMSVVEPAGIYIGTHRAYASLLNAQLPEIPRQNYILEPSRRDVAAAVALAFFSLEKDGVKGPIVFQWSDHYVRNAGELARLFAVGKTLVESHKAGMVIIAQEPSSANDSLGWIKLERRLGTLDGVDYHSFGEWLYRRRSDDHTSGLDYEKMFAAREWVWNTGHFVTSVEYMTATFRQRAPQLAQEIEHIVSFRGTPEERSKLDELYPFVQENSFDNVILRQISRESAVVVRGDLGWVDPGNLNSLKEAWQDAVGATVTRGNVVALRTTDALIYNDTARPVAVMGVSNLIVVELPDVTLVIDKASVRDLDQLLDEFAKREDLRTLL